MCIKGGDTLGLVFQSRVGFSPLCTVVTDTIFYSAQVWPMNSRSVDGL
jgi:hypothetical protein